MMISFSRLLTLSYIAIVALGITIAALLAWLSLEQAYIENQQTNVLAQAHLIAQTLRSTENITPETSYSQNTNILPGFHTHIIAAPNQPLPEIYTSMIAEDGPVVIGLQMANTSSQEIVAPFPPLAQNATGNLSRQELLNRPEVATAFEGRSATAIRTVLNGKRVLYAAAPIILPNGAITRIVYIATPLPGSGWAALSPSTQGQIAGLIALVIILTSTVGWRFSRILARTLEQIVAAAKQVAAGNLDSRLPADSSVSDIRLLSQSFNEMTDSLRRADQAKMAFVADVSHELRTPLTVIKGTVETLQDGAIDDLEAREGFLSSVASETERLIELVNGLLTLARADGGALKIQAMPLNLIDLAQTRVARMRGIAARKNIPLNVCITNPDHSPQTDGCCVLADVQRITQVLDNLLDNAIRYSRDGDQVRIVILPGATHVTCNVEDTGPGIAAAHLPFLFNRFYRVEASRNRSLGGSGLGLAICQAIIEAHSGTIGVQSVAGKGTTFSFTLPAAKNCP